MRYTIKITVLLTILVLAIQCKEEKPITPLNPNGDSELAILMREMYDDALQMKRDIATDKTPNPKLKDLDRMLHIEATEPEKQTTPEFKAFAHSYIQAIEAMDGKDALEREKLYDAAIMSCKNCHEALCPGPLVRVEKLIRKDAL